MIKTSLYDPGDFLSEYELAQALNRSPRTLTNWRSKRIGPPYIGGRRGVAPAYKWRDVLAWLEAQRVETLDVA